MQDKKADLDSGAALNIIKIHAFLFFAFAQTRQESFWYKVVLCPKAM